MAALTMQRLGHQWKVLTSGGSPPASTTYFRLVQRVPWYQAVLIDAATGVETPVTVTTPPRQVAPTSTQWDTNYVRSLSVS